MTCPPAIHPVERTIGEEEASLRGLLRSRLRRPPAGRFDATTILRDFAMVTYALPAERLAGHIPSDRFSIDEFQIDGERIALLSLVTFTEEGFCFPRIAPLHFRFAQTNHRVYIRDRQTGEPAVWFLGTTLSSPLVQVPRLLWKMPWHRGKYRTQSHYDERERRYSTLRAEVESDWAPLRLDLEDSGKPAPVPAGFTSRTDFLLRLTNPTIGFFRRLDGRLGRYSIWHPLMRGLTVGRVRDAWCGLYEREQLLSRAEMLQPHSVLIIPRIRFDVKLPPACVPAG